MSEWLGVYFFKNPMTITEFDEILVEEENVSSKVDRIDITYFNTGSNRGYRVVGYKDGKVVDLIPKGSRVKEILYCYYSDYDDNTRGRVYKIEIENKANDF